MGRQWTENQKNAINARGGSLIVSAAAGSGKTAVLVQRVIERITDSEKPCDADRLLVVTYTRAAAAEMLQRINDRISELLEKDPLNPALRRQQNLLAKADISTIHSFCSRVIREFSSSLDISADVRIGEDGELMVMRNEAMDLTLSKFYGENNGYFNQLASAFSSGRDDVKLRNIIFRLYDFLRSHPFADSWLQEKLSFYREGQEVSQTVWGKIIRDYCVGACQYSLSVAEISMEISTEEEKIYNAINLLLASDLAFLRSMSETLERGTWDEIKQKLSSFEKGTFRTPRGYKDHPLAVKLKQNREIIKSTVEEMQKLFAQSEEECLEDIDYLRPIVEQMFLCIKEFGENFSKLKESKNIVDYSDLEHYTLQILVKRENGEITFTEEADRISQRFDEVMVDEYQDANEVQDLIFKAISREKNLFVVGDVKQSIYGFRQAMPEIFLRRRESCERYNPDKDNYPAKIILEKNFRSRKTVTDGVNFAFERLMSKEVGDMEYNEDEMLVSGASYPETEEAGVEVHFLEYPSGGDMCVFEARHIAEEIRKLRSTMRITRDGQQVPPDFGDFAILLRSANSFFPIYIKELEKYGIPAVYEKSEGFLKNKEVALAMNILRIIDNPVQDIPLISVMMSPLYGFSADEMSMLRIFSDAPRLYGSMLDIISKYSEGNKTGETAPPKNVVERFEKFTEEISNFRAMAAVMSAQELMSKVYDVTGIEAVVSASGNGETAVNNLRRLREYAADYERNSDKGLSGFIRYVDRLFEYGSDLTGAANTQSQGSNSVRIMSIHKSKGLEFPICFVAAMSKGFVSDASQNVLIHSKLGVAMKRTYPELMCRRSTMPREALAIEMKRSEKSEELRVLYVAMTRAKEKLIMLCSSKDVEKELKTVGAGMTGVGKIPSHFVREAVSPGKWITMCSLLHPCCGELRKLADCEDIYRAENVQREVWKTEIFKYTQEEEEEITTEASCDENRLKEEEKRIEKILTERKNFKYPYSELADIPVKVTASALNEKERPVYFKKLAPPAFLGEEKLTAAQKGTAMHLFFQSCDFNLLKENPQNEVKRLAEKGVLSPAQAEAIDIKLVESFTESHLFKRITASKNVMKEYTFSVEIPVSMVNPQIQKELADEKVILQGAVDLAFEEKGKLVIVDYKTDRVKEPQFLAEEYRKQIALYKNAMEQTTGLEVSACLIYSIALGKEIEVLV